MSRILTINGIHSHGVGGTDEAGKDLAKLGYSVIDYDYPKRTAFKAWFSKNRIDDAKGLKQVAREGDHVVAHSYGCLIVLEAIRLGAKFDKLFFFGAAASSDRYPWFPMLYDGCNELYVIFNPKDKALKWGSRLPNHPFGTLGYKGYRGPEDSRVTSYPAMIDESGINHSSHLSNRHRSKWVHFIDLRIKRSNKQ